MANFKFSYPYKVLLRRFCSMIALCVIAFFVILKLLFLRGRPELALVFCAFFLAVNALPALALSVQSSTISVDEDAIRAHAFGIIWQKRKWSEMGYIQRVRTFADPETRTRLISDRLYIGRGETKTFRISFTPEIKGFNDLISFINLAAEKSAISLYSVNTVPKQYGQVREGKRVVGFGAET